MKELKEEFKYGRKGITLIALVITIIVLLILAGVSIATLTGENGILTRANDAKEKTEESEIREKIKLCALSSRINTSGDISYATFIEELDRTFGQNKYSINPQSANTSEWTVTVNNISELIKGKQPTLTNVITPENYGDSVNYSSNGINNWKIFYNDGENVFLITSDYLMNTKIPSELGIKTEGIYKVAWNELIYEGSQSINQEISNKYMLKNFINNKYAMKAVASLMDTEKWKSFVDNNLADTAIGSPTLEMFCESWNQKGYEQLYCNNYDNVGYFIGGNDTPNTITYDISSNVGYSDTLYFPYQDLTQDECWGYLLSSPCATDSGTLMRISKSGILTNRHYNVVAESLRPVVCLKSTVIGTKNVDTGVWNIE